MALTIAALIAKWHNATGSQESSDGVSALVGVNHALSHLSAMHQWVGMVRSAIPLATVQSQDYIDLPADLDEIISIEYQNAGWQAVKFTDMADLERIRTAGIISTPFTGTHWAALSWREGTSGPRQVLNIYPEASSTGSNTFRMSYRSSLIVMGTGQDTDTAVIQIPVYMEALALRLVSIFGKAAEEEDDAAIELRLENLHGSALFRAVKRRDGRTRATLGPMRNGAAQHGRSRYGWDYETLDPPS